MFAILIGIYVTLIIGVYLILPKAVFHPEALPPDHSFSIGNAGQEVDVITSDGQHINMMWFSNAMSKKLIIYFHGNKGTLERWGPIAQKLTTKGYAVLAFDYRGYGKSTGWPTEQGLYQDAKAVWEWAIQHYPPENITLYGRSLGSGIASHLATQVTPARVMLETPYYSIQDVVLTYAPFLWFPRPLQPNFSNGRNIPMIKCPVHIIHGTNDWTVPFASAKKLRPLLGVEKDFRIIEGGGHKNLASYPGYHAWLEEIL
jgi:alpha-beta hydrolase superfamily lysophospholipase